MIIFYVIKIQINSMHINICNHSKITGKDIIVHSLNHYKTVFCQKQKKQQFNRRGADGLMQ